MINKALEGNLAKAPNTQNFSESLAVRLAIFIECLLCTGHNSEFHVHYSNYFPDQPKEVIQAFSVCLSCFEIESQASLATLKFTHCSRGLL